MNAKYSETGQNILSITFKKSNITYNGKMVIQPIIDHWTIDHIFFGFITTFIIIILNRSKYRTYLIPFFILILWEIFEFREWPLAWLNDIFNNIMDLFAGLVGIIIAILIKNKLLADK